MANTVCAISTANAPGGIGVIRISGPEAVSVADRVFEPISGESLSEAAGYTCRFGHVYDKAGARLDQCIATVFRAPKSFTGEDAVELSCHGGLYVLQTVLAAVLAAGAAPAGPGEFTRRAFLNGKMDLAEAESVMELVSASGREAANAARAGQDGALSRRIAEIRAQLTDCCAHLAAWADYPDDDVPQVDADFLQTRITEGKRALAALLRNFSAGKIYREGVRTVIAGRPNAGKSTLMNLLAGEDRSIVTEIPGTTRDVVEETVRFADIPLRLADTAGLRETDDAVERVGVAAAKRRIEAAQLVLAVFDGAQPLCPDDLRLLREIAETPAVLIVNKNDLPEALDPAPLYDSGKPVVSLSASSGAGLDALERAVKDVLGASHLDPAAGVLYTERQRRDAEAALAYLEEAEAALRAGLTLDAVTVSLEAAVSSLLELTGERVTDAVVDEVFSKFCVGK